MDINTAWTNLWAKVDPSVKKELVSFSHTFIVTFLVALGTQLNGANWTKDILLAIIVSAARSAWKSGVNAALFPQQNP